MSEPEPLVPKRALVGYGMAAAPAQFMYMLVLVMYLKYAVDDLGASAAAIGTIFLVAKLWDAVSDPIVGNLSDRTTHRLGRRRLWLFASAPLLCAFGIMAWVPPSGLEGAGLIAWITVAVLGFYTAYTVFEVPHMALGRSSPSTASRGTSSSASVKSCAPSACSPRAPVACTSCSRERRRRR